MKYITDKHWAPQQYTAITLGNFDGFHTGHQKLIESVAEQGARFDLLRVVFSFYPHPVSVLREISGPGVFKLICSAHEKRWLAEQMGVDILLDYPFDEEFCLCEPEDFVQNILVKQMQCKVLVVGENYRFGKNRKGTAPLLKKLGAEAGILVIAIPDVVVKGETVSSSAIRRYIADKNFAKVQKLLTRPYFIMGDVVSGRQNGRKLGFPTANIIPKADKLLPTPGVYLTRTLYKGALLNSVTNIGFKPTIGCDHIVAETYLFDFNQEIYGEELVVNFYKWIRDEKKFSSMEELKEQIKQDIKILTFE